MKVMVSSCTHSLRSRSSKFRPKRPLVLPLAPEAAPLSTSGPTTQHLHVTGREISALGPASERHRNPPFGIQVARALLSDSEGSPEQKVALSNWGGNLERWGAAWAAASEGAFEHAAAPRRLAERDRLDGEALRRSEWHELPSRTSHREGYVEVGPVVPSLAHQRQRAAGVRLDELEAVGTRLQHICTIYAREARGRGRMQQRLSPNVFEAGVCASSRLPPMGL